ncbi:MAG: A24 family peptidase [Phycisphaerae bacterium]|jgi:prepilin signal peptidase PulO-like enzyme (type II secretory pathway)
MLDVIIGIFVLALGLCVGSFLNVVVYRLPAGLSVSSPARSFCPRCRGTIAWYDNIPVLSWLWLRARCRQCGAPISIQYPLVEAMTGLCFVLVYYALYAEHARVGAQQPGHPVEWPLLAAWLVLVATLIACAAMDVVSYMVDVRITFVAMIAGVVLYAGYPRPQFCTASVVSPWGAAAVVTALLSAVMLVISAWREPEEEEPVAEEAAPESTESGPSPALTVAGGVALIVLCLLALWTLAELTLLNVPGRDVAALHLPENVEASDVTHHLAHLSQTSHLVVPVALAALFATTVLVGGQRREADEEVRAAIEEEQPHARRVVLGELAWLALPIMGGVATYLALRHWPGAAAGWHAMVQWSPGADFCPMGGAAFALYGAVVGATAGWVLRIVFTLAFGREAMGTGDIYILAAAGAAGGWDIALFGLLLAVGIAVAGFVLGLLLKRSAIIPFGPWLALGFVAALWLNDPAADLAGFYSKEILRTWEMRPDICLVAGGLMLVGSVVAVVLARFVRQLVDAPHALEECTADGPSAPESNAADAAEETPEADTNE